jgi:integrase
MPTIRLTQLAAEKIAAPGTGRTIFWDRTLPGFGVRVTANGAKSWIASYRLADGRKVMETIGRLGKIPKVDDARRAARESMAKAATGENPVAEKRTAAAREAASTVATAVARYLEYCDRNLRPKTAREWRRIFEHDVLPRWGERPLAEITKGDVLELVNDKAARRERKRKDLTEGAGVQANRTLTRLRTFYGWAVANDLMGADPTIGVRKPVRETTRDRVLSDDELRAFWEATGTMGMPFGPLFRLVLLTAQRESETAGMRWSELDFDERQWEIPGARTKNGKPHTVHLSDLTIEVLDAISRIVDQDLLFSGRADSVVSGFSKAKLRLDARMRDAAGAEIPPWTLHDLRRTATSGMARLAIPPHICDLVLNHQPSAIRGTAAIYNRHQYLPERQAAVDTWGRFIESLTRPSPPNVVPIAAAR